MDVVLKQSDKKRKKTILSRSSVIVSCNKTVTALWIVQCDLFLAVRKMLSYTRANNISSLPKVLVMIFLPVY